MKGKSPLFAKKSRCHAAGNISFMGNMGDYSRFSLYISRRNDIDPDGKFDVIAHGNGVEIEIVNGGKILKLTPREAAKLIRKQPGYSKSKSVRLLSCNTGSLKNGFAQHLANALGKKVYAPNMTIRCWPNGWHWIEDNGIKGKFEEFVPGGYKNGK